MVSATYLGEDLEVQFSAQTEPSDYGVKGSPVWDEITDVTIEAVKICGVEFALRDLPMPLRNALHDLSEGLEFAA